MASPKSAERNNAGKEYEMSIAPAVVAAAASAGGS